MAIIPLRAYNREIEGLIDNGQLDEAVAHCRHILTTYPKYIATYRLLGKAHLEQQRISDATDIFQRVLSSVPDDFIANLGMSIIREDENNLDSSIWHMELAYEAQPANVAIQDELRRLYGRRDGMQPPKVRLTRGALARMYAKGGLYDQAIAELRAAIAEDPNRPDLQLLLAEMFFQTSQRIEAVDTCASIVKKIPFCLEANRILAVSLPEAEQTEAVKNYRQIVISMDPYYAFANPESLSSDEVPENAVNIERLDWKSGIQIPETPIQPNWATSLGISIEKASDENVPEWLKSAEATPLAQESEKSGSTVSPFIWDTQEVKNSPTDSSKPEAEIPEWMKDAGWRPASGAAPQATEGEKPEEAAVEATPTGDLEKAEIPEWLQGIAPEGVLGEERQAQAPKEGELSTPWLEQHQPGPTDSIVHWLEDNKPEKPRSRPVKEEITPELSEDEVPDWLKDLEPTPQPPAPNVDAATPKPAFTVEPTELFSETSQPELTEAHETPSDKTPEPKAPAMEGQPAAEGVELPGIHVPVEPAAASLDEVPDWLKDLAEEPPVTEKPKLTEEPQLTEEALAPKEAPVEEPSQVAEAAFTPEVPPGAEETSGIMQPAEAEIPSAGLPATAEELTATEPQAEVAELPTEEATKIAAELPSLEVPAEIEEVPAAETPAEVGEGPKEEALPITEEVPQVEVPAITEQPPAQEVSAIAEDLMPAVEPPMTYEQELNVEQPPFAEVEPMPESPITAEAEQAPRSEPAATAEEQPQAEAPLPAEAEQAPVAEYPATPEEQPQGEALFTAEAEQAAASEQPAVAEEQPQAEVPIPSEAEQVPAAEQPLMAGEQVQGEAPLEAAAEFPPPEPATPIEPEAIAWLEDLAAEHTAKVEAVPTPPEGAEIAPPEWVKLDAEPPLDETVALESQAAQAAPVPAEQVPDWIKGLGEEPEVQPTTEETISGEVAESELPPSEELPAWLRELEEPVPERGEGEPSVEGLAWKADEMPAWLKEITASEPTAEVPATEPAPTTVEAPAPVEAPAAEEIPLIPTEPASQWISEATPPAGIKKEALEEPPVEVAPLEPTVAEPAQPVTPVSPEVPVVAVPTSEEIRVVPEIPPEAQEISLETLQAVSKANQTTLGLARDLINQGQPTQAAESYSGLIKQNYHLDEIIKDLHDALYRFPVDIDLWVNLGDAYFRTDDLSEALSAYSKAEELVR